MILGVAMLVAAPAAGAVTVSGEVVSSCPDLLCSKYMLGEPRTVYRFTTAAGERSTATATRVGPFLRFHDETAPVSAGARCTQVDAMTVDCDTAANPAPVDVIVTGGAGDDVLTVATPLGIATTVDGGPGDDEIRGGAAGETLVGGPGADRITGGDGDDRIRGDGSAAPVTGGRSAPDVIDGGGGVDLVSYGERTETVDVDLGRPGATNGGDGEGDTLANVESIEGGGGDDRLAGNGGRNALLGGEGDDVLRARGGDDVLNGGSGRDTFDAGSGDDDLESADGEGDDLRCGAGGDTVTQAVQTGEYEDDVASFGPDAADVIHPDCEVSLVEDDSQNSRLLRVAVGAVRLRRGVLLVPNPCRHKRRCRTAVTVRPRVGSPTKIVGDARRNRARSIRVRLRGPTRTAARRGRVAITLQIAQGGSRWTTRFTAALS